MRTCTPSAVSSRSCGVDAEEHRCVVERLPLHGMQRADGPPPTDIDAPLGADPRRPPSEVAPEAQVLPSLGSTGHRTSSCRPCLFLAHECGCPRGVLCDFCHEKHARHRKARLCKDKRARARRVLSCQLGATRSEGSEMLPQIEDPEPMPYILSAWISLPLGFEPCRPEEVGGGTWPSGKVYSF